MWGKQEFACSEGPAEQILAYLLADFHTSSVPGVSSLNTQAIDPGNELEAHTGCPEQLEKGG